MAIDTDTIAANAAEPLQAASDGQQAQQVPIPDQIAANNYATGASALSGTNDNGGSKSAWACTRTARVKPGGPI